MPRAAKAATSIRIASHRSVVIDGRTVGAGEVVAVSPQDAKTLAVRVGPGRMVVAHDDLLGRDRTWAEGEVIDLVRGEARKLIASGDVEECA